ncbi:YqzE family protein [Heyndrickxia sporothermodurans]
MLEIIRMIKVVNSMSTNDYIKFITQTFVKHFDTPKLDRKQIRIQRKEEKAPFLLRWFGLLPYSVLMIFKRK